MVGRWRYLNYASVGTGVANICRLPMDPVSGTSQGAPEPVTAGVSAWADAPTVSADGKRLLFRVSTTSSNLAKVRFDSQAGRIEGEPTLLTRGTNGYCYVDASPDGERVVMSECSALLPDVEENVFVAWVDGQDRRALTEDEGKTTRLPRWTADGSCRSPEQGPSRKRPKQWGHGRLGTEPIARGRRMVFEL